VGELDGNFRGQLALPDVLEQPEIVIAYAGALVAARDLLAELGEHAAKTRRGEIRAAASAAPMSSPGMKRRTARRKKARWDS